MFPGAGAQVYYNEAGEPLGWDYPPDPGDMYDADEDRWLYDRDMPCPNCGDESCDGDECQLNDDEDE